MLFDLRGKRRRTVQATYLSLAILMGAGLVLFGIGSSVSGGLGDLLGFGGGGENQAEETIKDDIKDAEKTLKSDPRNEGALAELVRAHYQLAATRFDPQTSTPTNAARSELEEATDAWQRYLDVAEKPEDGLAIQAQQAYEGLAGLTKDPQDQKPLWEGASEAAEVLTNGAKKPDPYVNLVKYASLAGQTRKADLAGAKAIELAPKAQRKEVKQLVEQYKASATQGGQTAQPAPSG
jgi:hypothetical protein